jgi:hypothetical protein
MIEAHAPTDIASGRAFLRKQLALFQERKLKPTGP